MEGSIVWKKNQYMFQYFENGKDKLHPLHVGDALEIFLNDTWIKARIGEKNGEPIMEGINYGDGVGCTARVDV
ncbi:hypothetical protein TAMA11512_14440 [Selenomonas sp. TAMA-11512]|uniref:DUF5348 domain-containing protein n=1 Tax=Selenomonas sp. TAMA-11512 TaxID=3095337 RepID=UPI00308D40CB|nr:hypothetical protein TAMA11512_14440 [Selenomonas sp. TAMA-11512]